MKLTLGTPNWRGFGGLRMPGSVPLALVEVALIIALGILGARLVYAIATPLGPIGNWTATAMGGPSAGASVLERADLFARLAAAAGPAVVTSAPVKLFGVRMDQATGRGSAIIATPDGVQSSYAVGDEIMPGLILKQVMLDHVAIERGGVVEQLFLDQSVAAPVAQPGGAPAATGEPTFTVPSPDALRNGISFAPRLENGTITGLVVSPKGAGDVFTASGLQPGDILTRINGTSFRSAEEAAEAFGKTPPGGNVTLTVERAGKTTTISARGAK